MNWSDSRSSPAQIPQEKEKNEDQEWWKRYYHQAPHHERNNSQDSTNTTSSNYGSSYSEEPGYPPPSYSQAILSHFPSPPHSNPSTLDKPLPPIPLKKVVDNNDRGNSEKEKGDSVVVSTETQEQMEVEKSLPPRSLVRFCRGWRNENETSWERLCSEGGNMITEEYVDLVEALDRACASSIYESEEQRMGSCDESGDAFEKGLLDDGKWEWV